MPAPDCEAQLATLERLLGISTASLDVALMHACNEIAGALGADKVDAFLYDGSRDTLVAIGTSTQPLSSLQKSLGLDQLPIANGGRVVEVYRTGASFLHGHVDEDPEELRGIKEALNVRSTLGVPLEVGGRRKGVLMLSSLQPDRWGPDHARFAEAVARWVGTLAHHAELVEEIERNAAARGRQAAAEELVTTLAHDLRNIINPIDVRLQLMLRRAESEGRARDVIDAGKASGSLARLKSLVNDILDVARIEHGAFDIDPRPHDLTALVREIVDTLSTPRQPVICVATEDIVAVVDGARIRQCVENLIANAIKHSPRNAAINVVISRVVKDEVEHATLDVIDEGQGVSADVAPHLFQRFATGDKRKGLGIGLFLARRIAVHHGGDLTLESKPGEGARFRLTLPIA